MSEKIATKSRASGHKTVTNQIMVTPFGDVKVRISVGGYKSSEGDQTFSPPTETDSELDGAEAQAEES